MVTHPYYAPVSGVQTILEQERFARREMGQHSGDHTFSVVGIDLLPPQVWSSQPFRGGEAQDSLDLRANIEVQVGRLRCRDVYRDGEMLDEHAEATLRGDQLIKQR